MAEIKNLTPHDVTVAGTVIPRSGQVARVSVSSAPAGEILGLPVVRQVYGEVIDLPEQKEDTFLLVSSLVRGALPERKDLLSPGELIRDSTGQPIGCKGLVAN